MRSASGAGPRRGGAQIIPRPETWTPGYFERKYGAKIACPYQMLGCGNNGSVGINGHSRRLSQFFAVRRYDGCPPIPAKISPLGINDQR